MGQSRPDLHSSRVIQFGISAIRFFARFSDGGQTIGHAVGARQSRDQGRR